MTGEEALATVEVESIATVDIKVTAVEAAAALTLLLSNNHLGAIKANTIGKAQI